MIDIIKLIAGGLLALCSCYIGILIKRHYIDRHKFYRSALDFATVLSTELSFKKTPLPDVVNTFLKDRKGGFEKLLGEYMQAAKRGDSFDKQLETIDIAHIKPAEKKNVLGFLNDLGKTSLDDQLSTVARASKEFENAEKKCAEESKKLGGMYFKLAVLLGLAIIVIAA